MSQLFMLLIFLKHRPNRIFISMAGVQKWLTIFFMLNLAMSELARKAHHEWNPNVFFPRINILFIFRLATTIGCSRTDKAALVSGVPRPILLSWSQQQLCQTSTKKEKEPLWCTTEKGSWKRWVGCSEQHTPRTICWLVTVWHFSLMWSIKHTKLLLHSSHRQRENDFNGIRVWY